MDPLPRFTPAATTLDAPDARELARFHQGPLGRRARKEEPGRDRAVRRHRRAVVPDGAALLPPAVALHPDRAADDGAAGHQGGRPVVGRRARPRLGAALAGFRPQADVRVLCDPAGRPFCLFVRTGRGG